MCRKRYAEESTRNRTTERKDVRRLRGTTSDHSSAESGERCHGGAKYDGHQHTKHGRGHKHAAKAADTEERRSEKYSSKSSSAVDSNSAEVISDQGRGAGSKYHSSKQTDETISADDRRHGKETESRRKRSSDSGLNSSASVQFANSDDGNSKRKQAKTESVQTAVQSKTARQTVGTTYENAVARYLARKGKLGAPVVCEDSD